jgi:hypothetical protein
MADEGGQPQNGAGRLTAGQMLRVGGCAAQIWASDLATNIWNCACEGGL